MVTINDGETRDGVTAATMLDALNEARVFKAHKGADGRFVIEESCDHYFCAFLTREQLLALADELRALAST